MTIFDLLKRNNEVDAMKATPAEMHFNFDEGSREREPRGDPDKFRNFQAPVLTINQLEKMIREQPPFAIPFIITPEIAQHILETYNENNRPVATSKVREYMRDIADGEWYMVGDTISFSDKPRLFDGQHRLIACVRSNNEIQTLVYFGVDDSLFWFKDKGKSRRASDGLSILGWSDPVLSATTIRWLELFRRGIVKTRRTFSNAEVKEATAHYNRRLVAEAVRMGGRIYRVDRTSKGLVAAIYYMAMERNPRLATAFFDAWVTGRFGGRFRGLEKATRIIRQKRLEQSGRIHDVQLAALLVTAWNLAVENRAGASKDFMFDVSTDDFPSIGG